MKNSGKVSKALAIFLATASLMGLAACGNGSSSSPSATNSLSAQAKQALKDKQDAAKIKKYLQSSKVQEQIKTANEQMKQTGSMELTSSGKTVIMTLKLKKSALPNASISELKKRISANTDQYTSQFGPLVSQIEKETGVSKVKLTIRVQTDEGDKLTEVTVDDSTKPGTGSSSSTNPGEGSSQSQTPGPAESNK